MLEELGFHKYASNFYELAAKFRKTLNNRAIGKSGINALEQLKDPGKALSYSNPIATESVVNNLSSVRNFNRSQRRR